MPASYFAYLSAATLVYLLIVQAAKGRLFRQAGPDADNFFKIIEVDVPHDRET